MQQHLVYVASARQIELTKGALARLKAEPVDSKSSLAPSYLVRHRLLGHMVLQVHLIAELDAITPHLRQNPVDLLVYDERHGGLDALKAFVRIRDDMTALAAHWGPDFLFPMSRFVAILNSAKGNAQRSFELGRLDVRDVCIAPENTATVLRWLQGVLKHGIIRENRVGMALSGGGIEGFLFQLGALHAIERALSSTKGRRLDDCDVYSGVSSGSIAASMLAAKVPLIEVIKALHSRSELLAPLGPSTVFDLAGRDILKRVVTESVQWRGLNPQRWINNTMRSVPTGFFRGDGLQSYIEKALRAMGKPDSFGAVDSELYIGATDQDSFEHVVMGRFPWDDVPVSQAIRASCALPPIFVPARINGRWFIDGQVTRTCNLELVIDRGCRLVFIIDPIKPLATAMPGTVDKQGGVYSLIQVVKALVYTRFEMTLKHLTERYPDIDFIVIQPDEQCAELMAGSPMRYRFRTQLVQLAYRSTLRKLRERYPVYAAKLARFGFHLCAPEYLLQMERDSGELEDFIT